MFSNMFVKPHIFFMLSIFASISIRVVLSETPTELNWQKELLIFFEKKKQANTATYKTATYYLQVETADGKSPMKAFKMNTPDYFEITPITKITQATTMTNFYTTTTKTTTQSPGTTTKVITTAKWTAKFSTTSKNNPPSSSGSNISNTTSTSTDSTSGTVLSSTTTVTTAPSSTTRQSTVRDTQQTMSTTHTSEILSATVDINPITLSSSLSSSSLSSSSSTGGENDVVNDSESETLWFILFIVMVAFVGASLCAFFAFKMWSYRKHRRAKANRAKANEQPSLSHQYDSISVIRPDTRYSLPSDVERVVPEHYAEFWINLSSRNEFKWCLLLILYIYFYWIRNKIQRFSDVFELNCTKNNQTVNKKRAIYL